MGRRLVALKAAAEDLFLGFGFVLVSVGMGVRFGAWCGLVVAGVLSIAYGVWITPGKVT